MNPTALSRPRGGRRTSVVVWTSASITAALFVVLNCSGLLLPIPNGTGRLSDRLSTDPGLSLPAGTKVARATRDALRDPAEFFHVELPAGTAATFMAQVHAASTSPRIVPAAAPFTIGRTPSWWTPLVLPGVTRLDVSHADASGGYIWYYSPSADTLYVCWFRI